MNAHPSIDTDLLERWRLIKNGGDDFVEEFLVQREKEDGVAFSNRQDMAYDPATASSAVEDVVNSLAARLDVTRTGGSPEYQNVVAGRLGGVDRNGSSMNDFIIRETLPELCFMQRVCWVVQNFTDDEDTRKFPWIKMYRAEEIFNWAYQDNKLVAFAIKFQAKTMNPETGFLNDDEKAIIQAFTLKDGRVETWFQTEDDTEVDPITLEPGSSRQTLDIDEIPVIDMQLPVGLLSKIDRMQIAALNLESADIEWLRTGNITLYVEQGSGFHPAALVKSADGTAEPDVNEVTLGSSTGRQYPMDAERPAFISPSPEPIRASMEKQKHIAERVREILKTTLSDMKLASAESLGLLGQGMEAGLFGIGTVLNLAEVKFARIFHKYQNRGEIETSIGYPVKYELTTQEDRLNKATKIKEIAKNFGSNTAKKYLEIQAIETLLGGKVPFEDMEAIKKEILDSEFCIYDPETVEVLVQAGIISRALAAESIGAPEGDSVAAEEEHIRRIVAVQVSQTSGTGSLNPDPKLAEDVRKEAAIEVRDAGAS